MTLNEDQIRTNCGDVSLEPTADAVAGTYGEWTITYTVGMLGMDDGSTLRIASNMSSDWGPPQFDDPIADNYCTVETSGDASVSGSFDNRGHTRPWRDTILVEVYDGALAPGETITVTLGDRSEGSMGLQIQSYPETEFELFGLVEPFETGEYVRLPTTLSFEIVPGAPESVAAVVDSEVTVGDEATLSVRLQDYWGNVATEHDDTIALESPAEGAHVPETVELKEGTAHATVRFDDPGTYRIPIRATESGLRTETNPIRCTKPGGGKTTYWGDIHGQSEETVGTNPIEEYFTYARDCAFVDFASHAGNDFQITDEFWETVRETVREFNDAKEFVTFLCYEWSANTPNGGDHNVYFRGDEPDIHRSSDWQVADGPERSGGTYPVEQLYEQYRGRDDVFIIPHQGGRPATLDALDPDLTPFVEILSVWGIFEWFGQEAVKRGYPVGFVAGSDDHTGRPGASHPAVTDWSFPIKGGLMAAKAMELTRDSLWTSFRERRCYATTGARILLDVTVDGCGMGQEVTVDGPPQIDVDVSGTAPIYRIDLFRGGEQVDGQRFDEGSEFVEFTWSGARSKNRNKIQDWSGGLSIDRGAIETVRPFGFDHPEDGIQKRTTTSIEWSGSTAGNYQGIRVDVDGPPETTLSFSTEPVSTTAQLGEVEDRNMSLEDGVEQELSIHRVGECTRMDAKTAFEDDEQNGTSPYYVRVTQVDGEMAWSSPVFVDSVSTSGTDDSV
jgi:hypothetical protein